MSLVFLLFALKFTNALYSYKSTLSLLEANHKISGLHLLKNDELSNTNYSNSFSTCIRFNYNRLGIGNEARIFDYAWPAGSARPFLYMYARYPQSWMSFGHYENPTAFTGLILSENQIYNIWATQRWHHLCLAFDKANWGIRIVKVSHIIFPIRDLSGHISAKKILGKSASLNVASPNHSSTDTTDTLVGFISR